MISLMAPPEVFFFQLGNTGTLLFLLRSTDIQMWRMCRRKRKFHPRNIDLSGTREYGIKFKRERRILRDPRFDPMTSKSHAKFQSEKDATTNTT